MTLPFDLPVPRPFTLPIEVTEEDIDAQRHVSNVRIVAWMSRLAWRHSCALGYDMAQWHVIGGWFVVRRHEVDYHASAVLGDRLLGITWPSKIGRVTAERRHQIRRLSDGRLIAEGLNVWAYVDIQTGRPARIPRAVADAFDPAHFS